MKTVISSPGDAVYTLVCRSLVAPFVEIIQAVFRIALSIFCLIVSPYIAYKTYQYMKMTGETIEVDPITIDLD